MQTGASVSVVSDRWGCVESVITIVGAVVATVSSVIASSVVVLGGMDTDSLRIGDVCDGGRDARSGSLVPDEADVLEIDLMARWTS